MTSRLHGVGVLLLLLGATAASAQEAKGFRADDVERMKAWAIQNATGGSPRDCLETLNKNLRLLYDDPGMRLSSTIDRSMAALQGKGRAEATKQFDFFDEDDRPTIGVTKPVRLRESVWDKVCFVGESFFYKLVCHVRVAIY